MPSTEEIHDNAVAMWVPQDVPQPGSSLAIGYTLSWYSDDATRPPGGRVVSTRRDRGNTEDAHRFVIDFAGKTLNALPAKQDDTRTTAGNNPAADTSPGFTGEGPNPNKTGGAGGTGGTQDLKPPAAPGSKISKGTDARPVT